MPRKGFDLLAKPVGRIVLNLEALLSYCHVVIRERGATSVEGQGRLGFLQRITDQSVILLVTMADTSDDRTRLTRLNGQRHFRRRLHTCRDSAAPRPHQPSVLEQGVLAHK